MFPYLGWRSRDLMSRFILRLTVELEQRAALGEPGPRRLVDSTQVGCSRLLKAIFGEFALLIKCE
jgi:hypothetical protein